jgi:hypothetical protein
MRNLASGVLAACYLASTSAWGQEERPVPLGFYGGASIGLASMSVEVDDGYYYFPGYEDGEEATAVDVHFGYRLTRYIATEFAYFDSAPEWEDAFVYIPELGDSFDVFVDSDVQAAQFTLLGVLPFARIWEGYIKGGFAYWQGDADQTLIRSSNGEVLRRFVEDSSTDFLFAVGIGANPKPGWHLRLEFQSFGIDRDLVAADGPTTIDSMLFQVHFQPGTKSKTSDAVAALTERFERRIGAH